MDEGYLVTDNTFKNAHRDVEQVNIGDRVGSAWGISKVIISESDIEHLKKGGVLWYDDGEYAHLISLPRSLDERDS